MNRPAAAALGCTAAYGALKLSWALGGTFGLRQVPLPPDAIRDALDRTPGAVLGHWLSAAAAVLGIVVALVLMRPAPTRGTRLLIGVPVVLLAVGMILRAVLQSIGDGQRLLAGVSPDAATTARWDLFLWSPYFLLWGVCWALAVRHWRQNSSYRPTRPAAGRPGHAPESAPSGPSWSARRYRRVMPRPDGTP